jgi:hypothetical protein
MSAQSHEERRKLMQLEHKTHVPQGMCICWGYPEFHRWKIRQRALLCLCLLILASLAAHPAMGQPPQKTEIFFSQGQAMYYPDDTSRSQLEATQDLISSGVLQAVSRLLGPASTQSLFGAIQQKILLNKDKYVDGYQLASEGLANGLYRVTGQVTVAKDLLVKDLMDNGFQLSTSSESTLPDLPQEKRVLGSSVNSPPETDAGKPELARSEVLWAVAENWDAKWSLPSESAVEKPTSLASNILRSTKNQDWTLRLPTTGSIQIDKQGNTDENQLMNISREIGIEKTIAGKTWLDSSQPGNQRLLASLRIIDVRTGKLAGEVRKERPLGEVSIEEGILHLAESLLPSVSEELAGQPPSPKVTPRSDSKEVPGTWTVVIRAQHPPSAWESIRKEVENRFRTAQTSGFEMGATEMKVVIDGIDGRSLRNALDNKSLAPNGQIIRIEDFSEEQRSMVVRFGNSVTTQ